jgi:hypothetical protein
MFWFGSFSALKLGFWQVAWGMLRVLKEYVKLNLVFPISYQQIYYLELFCRILCKDKDRIKTLNDLLSKIDQTQTNQEVIDSLHNMKSLLLDTDTFRGPDYGIQFLSMTKESLKINRLYGALTNEIEW